MVLEDVPTDAELIQFELGEAGIPFTARCAEDRASYLKALDEFSPDIILSDYSLPSFDGVSALRLAQKKCPDIPFIFVSGALGEETAIELLKQGATDYVLKCRLSRLGPAVSRAIQEVKERRERVRYENELKESEIRYRAIFENTGTATVIIDEQMNVVMANKQFVLLSGFSKEEIEGKKRLKDFLHQDDLLAWDGCEEPPSGQEFRIVGRKGDVFHVLANVARIPSTNQKVLSLLDVTKLKKTEKEKREVLRYTKSQIDAGIDPLMTISMDGKITDVNRATESVTGLSRDALIGSDFAYHFTEPSKARKGYLEILSKGFIREYPLAIPHVSGRLTEVLYNAWLYRNEEGEVQGIFAAARDVTEWVAAEKKILASNEMLRLMTSEILMTEEREQRRIAVELHDNIGQTLALAKIKLDSLLTQAAASGVTKPLLEIREMINLSIAQTRSLMGEINPSILKELGLTEAIKGLCEKIREREGLRIILKADPKIGQPDEQVQFLIFRAVRELLMNVVKHARAKRVCISLKNIGENLMVAVKDNGVGFDLASIDQVKARTAGFGLLSIRESLHHMGGLCEIETKEGKGTSVALTVPRKWRKTTDA